MTLNGQEIGAGENQPHFRTRAPGPQIFIIPHRQQFVKRKVAQKLNNYFSRICALLPIDFWCSLWYTNGVKGRDNTPKGLGLRAEIGNDPQKLGREKKSRKKIKKPLDKPNKMCYNKGTKREARQRRKAETHESRVRP